MSKFVYVFGFVFTLNRLKTKILNPPQSSTKAETNNEESSLIDYSKNPENKGNLNPYNIDINKPNV